MQQDLKCPVQDDRNRKEPEAPPDATKDVFGWGTLYGGYGYPQPTG